MPVSYKLLDPSIWRERYFDGTWRLAPAFMEVREPATGGVLGIAGAGTASLTIELANKVAKAQPEWARTPADDRARIMRKAAQIIEENTTEITEWIVRETGGVRPKAGFEIGMAIG